jgi:Zn-dependent peptidase ImmA (M78 family)
MNEQSFQSLEWRLQNGPKPVNLGRDTIEHLGTRFGGRLGAKPGESLEELVSTRLADKITLVFLSPSDTARYEGEIACHAGSTQIFLSTIFPSTRRRFTLAHELGHWILHASGGAKNLWVARSGNSDDLAEREANWFAAGMLMPKDKFVEAFTDVSKQWNGSQLPESFVWLRLARRFDVSVKAAQVRAQFLHLDLPGA